MSRSIRWYTNYPASLKRHHWGLHFIKCHLQPASRLLHSRTEFEQVNFPISARRYTLLPVQSAQVDKKTPCRPAAAEKYMQRPAAT